MKSSFRILKCVVLRLALAMTALTPTASAVQLIANGGFETGTFDGWTVAGQAGGSGSFLIDGAAATGPLSENPTAGPESGSFYAVSDQVGPSTNALIQTFVVPGAASSVLLSFDMFVNDSAGGPFIDPSGLDYTSGGTSDPNQHARVDILSAIATPFDTGAGLLTNLYIGADPQHQNPNPYTHYAFDITALVGTGGTFQIRFAEVDNLGNLNQGIDNVSIIYAAVPEPSAALLIGLGLASLARARRRVGD